MDKRTDRLLDVLEVVGLAIALEVVERKGARPGDLVDVLDCEGGCIAPRHRPGCPQGNGRPARGARRRPSARGTKVREARARGGRYWVDPYVRELRDGRRILNRGHWRTPPRERPGEAPERNPEAPRPGGGGSSQEGAAEGAPRAEKTPGGSPARGFPWSPSR